MLSALQRAVVESLWAEAPWETLQRKAVDPTLDLDSSERDLLKAVAPDGFALTSLLARKLRLERLLKGDPDLAPVFERDPEGFSEQFQCYCREMPSEAFFPKKEALAWKTWRDAFPKKNRPGK